MGLPEHAQETGGSRRDPRAADDPRGLRSRKPPRGAPAGRLQGRLPAARAAPGNTNTQWNLGCTPSPPAAELTGHSQEASGEVGREVSGGLWTGKTKKLGLGFQGEITEEEKNVFNLIKSDLFTSIATPGTRASLASHTSPSPGCGRSLGTRADVPGALSGEMSCRPPPRHPAPGPGSQTHTSAGPHPWPRGRGPENPVPSQADSRPGQTQSREAPRSQSPDPETPPELGWGGSAWRPSSQWMSEGVEAACSPSPAPRPQERCGARGAEGLRAGAGALGSDPPCARAPLHGKTRGHPIPSPVCWPLRGPRSEAGRTRRRVR